MKSLLLPLIALALSGSAAARQPRFGPSVEEFTAAMEQFLPASLEGQAAGWHCTQAKRLQCRPAKNGNAQCTFRDLRGNKVKMATLRQEPGGHWTVLGGDHPICHVTIW